MHLIINFQNILLFYSIKINFGIEGSKSLIILYVLKYFLSIASKASTKHS